MYIHKHQNYLVIITGFSVWCEQFPNEWYILKVTKSGCVADKEVHTGRRTAQNKTQEAWTRTYWNAFP